NPPDLLGSERMKKLVSRLRETFDYVVLDTPPVGPVVDPVIITKLADKTIFVVQWASTPRELWKPPCSSCQYISVQQEWSLILLAEIMPRNMAASITMPAATRNIILDDSPPRLE